MPRLSMPSSIEDAGIYGFVNGLGYHGDPTTKNRLIQRAQRAANRGDWEIVLEMGLAYLLGAGIGGFVAGN
jgi:hypothetical protein